MKVNRDVVIDTYVKDMDNVENITSYESLSDVKEQFKQLKDCKLIEANINNKKVIFVINKNSIFVYKYKR